MCSSDMSISTMHCARCVRRYYGGSAVSADYRSSLIISESSPPAQTAAEVLADTLNSSPRASTLLFAVHCMTVARAHAPAARSTPEWQDRPMPMRRRPRVDPRGAALTRTSRARESTTPSVTPMCQTRNQAMALCNTYGLETKTYANRQSRETEAHV